MRHPPGIKAVGWSSIARQAALPKGGASVCIMITINVFFHVESCMAGGDKTYGHHTVHDDIYIYIPNLSGWVQYLC